MEKCKNCGCQITKSPVILPSGLKWVHFQLWNKVKYSVRCKEDGCSNPEPKGELW